MAEGESAAGEQVLLSERLLQKRYTLLALP